MTITKIEFRGLVELKNQRNKTMFKGHLTEVERENLLKFIQNLKTNDKVNFDYYTK